MIQLFIEDREVELKDDLLISFNYETIDPDNLSKIKNSFSKTVDIPGTSNNNAIFGDLFRIDRYVPSTTIEQQLSGTKNIGFQFDPHKKTEFSILSNGSLVVSGYCVLNEIVINGKNEITYKVTLYGGIGNFFYNLTYNEIDENSDNKENNKNLADLYWNWRGKYAINDNSEPFTKAEEDENTIMKASTSVIAESYSKLKPIEEIFEGDRETYEERENYWNKEYDRPYPITDIDKDVVFVPCYTGNYDDFDSNKMIVSTFNQDYDTQNTYSDEKIATLRNSFPETKTIVESDGESVTTTTYNVLDKYLENGPYSYGIATFSRDLDPWEAGDIRVNEMPVAIRLSKLLRTVSMPWNNGGYDVEWDEDITNSPYWNYSWVMLGKIKKESEGFSPNEISIDGHQSFISYRYRVLYDYQPVTHLIGAYDRINTSISQYQTFSGNVEKGDYNILLRYLPKYDLQFNGDEDDLDTPGYYITGGYKTSENITYMQFDVIYNEIRVENAPDFWTRRDFNFDIYFYTEFPNTFGFGFGGPVDEMLKQIRCELISKIQGLDNSNFPESDIPLRMRVHNISGEHGERGPIDFQGDTTNYNGIEITCPTETVSMRLSLDETKNVEIDTLQFSMFLVYSPNAEYPMSVGMIITEDIVDPMEGNYYTNTSSYSPNVITNTDLPYYPYGNFVILENRSTGGIRIHTFMSTSTIGAIAQNHHFDLNGDASSIYMINTDVGSTLMEFDKSRLFAESKSPAKYLIDFCKMMNYRFICDEYRKKIYVKTLKNYYKYIGDNDISDLIDYSRDINIKNITTTNRLIEFGLDNLQTYPIELSERVSKEKFSTKKYNTKVEWNQQTSKLLNDLIYKNVLEWQMSSVFFNLYPQLPKPYNTPTISWTLFNTDNGNLEKKEFIETGVQYNGTSLIKQSDKMPKIGFFDKDNKYVQSDTNLIFLNGFVKNYDYSYTKQTYGEKNLLEPNTIKTNKAINYETGQETNTTQQDVYVYDNIDASNSSYYITVAVAYGFSNRWVNYYDIVGGNEVFLSSEFPQTSGYNQEMLNIPNLTKRIKINVKKGTESSFKLEIATAINNYAISPRNQLSEDTIEQYLLNGNRCYTYDFKYNDNFNSWGSWSSDQKGCACPWILPFFTRELYNEYERYEDGYEYNTVRLTPVRKYPNTKFDRNDVILSNTNYSQFEFWLPDPEPGWETDSVLFNATYPDTESGVVLWLQNIGTATVDYQGEYSPSGQHTFVDGTVNTFGGVVKIIRMNTYVAQGGDDTYYIDVRFRKPIYHYQWRDSGKRFASWNLVKQDIITEYDVSQPTFITRPDLAFTKFANETQLETINANEYKILTWPDFPDYIFDTNWKDYMDDLYDRNTRDVTLYLDLTGLGTPSDILRRIYSWKGFLWVITKIENRQVEQIGKDKFTKCTIHKIKNLNTWTNN